MPWNCVGKKISLEEYDTQTEHHTKKALNELKEYLLSHPEEANRYIDIFREDDKTNEASYLLRFMHHGYAGRPRKDHDQYSWEKQYDNHSSNSTLVLRYSLIILMTVGLIAMCLSIVKGYAIITHRPIQVQNFYDAVFVTMPWLQAFISTLFKYFR